MRWAAMILFCVLSSACQRPPEADEMPSPQAYSHFQDRVMAHLFNLGIRWRAPCSGIDEHEDSISWEEHCFRFTKPQRMTGLWRNGFEDSLFCQAPAQRCSDGPPAADRHRPIYGNLEFRSDPGGLTDTPPGGLYQLDFIGRRSEYGLYGGTSNEDKQVIVDRVISIKLVQPPPAEPTKAELIKQMKACEAAKTCIPNWDAINGEDEAQTKKAHIEGYLKDCAGKQICMPNSEAVRTK